MGTDGKGYQQHTKLAEELTVEVMDAFGENIVGRDHNADLPLTKFWSSLTPQQRTRIYSLHRQAICNAIKKVLEQHLEETLV